MVSFVKKQSILRFNYVTEKNIIHDTNKTESTTFYVQDI